MPEIGQAYVNIVPKAKGIEKNMESLLGGPASAAGTSAGKAAGTGLVSGLKKAASVLAVGKVIKDAFDAGGNIQQSFGGLDTLYADAAESAKNYAHAAAEAGISANSYAEQAVSFGAALKAAYDNDTTAAMEAANTAILDMADNAAKMGTPLESIQQAYQGFARGQYTLLDNLKLGYGGTKTEMQRLLADAQKITGIKYDINNLGDVYDAIHVIQGELGLTGVAAEEAKTTLLGSAGAMKASWENLLAAMMTGEGTEEAIANLTESVGYFSENVINMLGEVAPQIPDLVMGIFDTLLANAPALLDGGIELVAQLAVGFVEAIPLIVEKVPELFVAVVEAVAGADWESIGNAIIEAVWTGMQTIWNSVVDWFNDRVNSLHGTAYIDVYTRQYGTSIDESGWTLPGYATGLDRVPYDNFPALLHEDEMVVKASLAEPLRASGFSNKASNADSFSRMGGNQTEPMQTVVKIEFGGSMAQLARILAPEIKIENERIGPSLIG